MHSRLIHERTINIKVFETGEDKILIEGTLTDERLCPTFIYLLSRIADPMIVHNITVRVGLSLPDLTIESIETDMNQVPAEMCKGAKDTCYKLVGVSMLRGFNRKLKELTGGVNGCVHLNNLLLSIGACAYQGSYTYYRRVQEDGTLRKVHLDDSLLVNSCHVWKESGPFASQLEALKEAAKNTAPGKTKRSKR